MDTDKSLDKLKELNSKLTELNARLTCPVIPESARVQALAIQYDIFMEFIGLYEDTLNYLDSEPLTDDNEFKIKQTKKTIQNYWRQAIPIPF